MPRRVGVKASSGEGGFVSHMSCCCATSSGSACRRAWLLGGRGFWRRGRCSRREPARASCRPRTTAPPITPTAIPGRKRRPAWRGRRPHPPGRRSQPQHRVARLHACRSLSRRRRPAAGDVPVPAEDRRAGTRPDQGVPLRPGHAGRLAHRDRCGRAGAHRQGVRARRRRRPAGPPRGRPASADRDGFMRNLALEKAAAPRPGAAGRTRSQTAGDTRPVVVIDPGHGGSTPAPLRRAARTRRRSCSNSR